MVVLSSVLPGPLQVHLCECGITKNAILAALVLHYIHATYSNSQGI